MKHSSLGTQSRLLERRARQLLSQPWSFRPQTRRGFSAISHSARASCYFAAEKNLSPAQLCSLETLLPVPVDRSMDVLESPVSTATTPVPLFKISGFEKTKYRADALNADRLAQTARLTNADNVQKLHNMVCKSRWMNGFGSFSVAEKNRPSEWLSFPPQFSTASSCCRFISPMAFIAAQ